MNKENESTKGRMPLGMLPVRTVEAPRQTTLNDSTVYEFSVLGAAALNEGTPWNPIVLSRAGREFRLIKPVSGQTSVITKSRLTEHSVDVRYTIFALETELSPEPDTLQPTDLYPIIHEMVHLLRTVARQYWMGLAMANEGSVYNGIRARIENGIATFLGQGSFNSPFVVTPLDEQSWQFLGALLRNQTFPTEAEVILCDALLDIRRAAVLQAALLLGVSSEVAINQFLDELMDRQSMSKTKKDAVLQESFKTKFLTRCVEFGTSDPATAAVGGFGAGWADVVCKLYRIRNQAAHGGSAQIEENGLRRNIEMRDIPKLLFSAEALLAWIDQNRVMLGSPRFATTTMLPMGYPISAMSVPGQP